MSDDARKRADKPKLVNARKPIRVIGGARVRCEHIGAARAEIEWKLEGGDWRCRCPVCGQRYLHGLS